MEEELNRTGASTSPTPSGSRYEPWLLDPDVLFLNHGSFGACPRPVLQRQSELRQRLEREPVHFFVREMQGLLDAARAALAAFVGADPENLSAVRNATSGVNAVLRSLDLQPGDELLVTDHEYNACRNAIEYVARRCRAHVRLVAVPFPLQSPDQVVNALLEASGPRTRLALVDHVTSQTGLVLPVGRLVAALEGRGIPVLVDGAHGPGMVHLELDALGASWYTGNCHKWLCAPKGAAFLYARRDRQPSLHPLTISHGYNRPRLGRSRFHDLFDWTGTDDPTPFLCLPAAIAALEELVPGGWPEVQRRNRALALQGRAALCRALGVPPPAPEDMIGSLASIPLPDRQESELVDGMLYEDPLQDRLVLEHRIQVPVIPWPEPPRRLLRISAQLYNRPTDYERLAAVLPGLL